MPLLGSQPYRRTGLQVGKPTNQEHRDDHSHWRNRFTALLHLHQQGIHNILLVYMQKYALLRTAQQVVRFCNIQSFRRNHLAPN